MTGLQGHTLQRVYELSEQGWTARAIAIELGCSLKSVRAVRRAGGFSRQYRTQGRVTEERRHTILELSAAGWKLAQIAAEVGLCTDSVSRVRAAAGISRPTQRSERSGRSIDQETLDRVRRFLDGGASFAEVNRSTGVTFGTLHRHFPGRGWTQSEGGAYGRLRREELRQEREARRVARRIEERQRRAVA